MYEKVAVFSCRNAKSSFFLLSSECTIADHPQFSPFLDRRHGFSWFIWIYVNETLAPRDVWGAAARECKFFLSFSNLWSMVFCTVARRAREWKTWYMSRWCVGHATFTFRTCTHFRAKVFFVILRCTLYSWRFFACVSVSFFCFSFSESSGMGVGCRQLSLCMLRGWGNPFWQLKLELWEFS